MSPWEVAAPATDSSVVRAARRHHASLARGLSERVEAVIAAVEGHPEQVSAARSRLVGFCETQLLPHAEAEEMSVYPAAATEGRARLLVEALTAQHRVLAGLVEVVRDARHPVRAAAAAEALRVLFVAHLATEDDIVLPLVAAVPNLSLTALMAELHDLIAPVVEEPDT